MKILRYDNPAVTATATTTSAAISSGDTVITVTSSTGFSANDFVLIEAVGSERAEVRKISSVGSSTSITLTAATTLAHDSGVDFTKISYDKYRMDYSTDGTNYTAGTATALDYTNHWNIIYYYNEVLDDTMYYKIYYYNSQTSTSSLQTTLTPATCYFGYITYDDFAAETSFNTDYITRKEIEYAIWKGAEEVRRLLYVNRFFETYSTDTVFDLDLGGLELADGNYSLGDTAIQVDKYDIEIYEEDANGFRTYCTKDIVKIYNRALSPTNKELKIELSTTRPATSSNKLVFRMWLTYRQLDEMLPRLKDLNRLLAINYLFEVIPVERLQDGIPNWNGAGTGVQFDANTIYGLIDRNKKEVLGLVKSLQKFRVNVNTMQKDSSAWKTTRFVDSLSWR